jgi:hypothetical protein
VRTVEVEHVARNSFALAAARGDSAFPLVAEGRHESYQASQQCSQRQPFPAFEPGNSDGMRIVTIKTFYF